MTAISYDPKDKRIGMHVDGVMLPLNPVIEKLHKIGKNMIDSDNYVGLIHHNSWGMICPHDLHGTASKVSYDLRHVMPKINPEIVEFASSEIVLSSLPILKLEDKHNEQILRALDDIGRTWDYTENKEEAESQINKYGIPLLISTKGLSEKERIKRFRAEYIFIDQNLLVETALSEYDKALLTESKDAEKFRSMNLDDLYLGIGLNLYKSGIATIKLYEE